MGLCAGETTKKKKPIKTIIIPKGVINPNQNNVIEIPVHLDANSSLIVKAPTDSKACLLVEPYSNVSNDFRPVQATPASPPQDVYFMDQANSGNSIPLTYVEPVLEPAVPIDLQSRRGSVPLEAALPTRKIDFGIQTSIATLQSAQVYPPTVPAQTYQYQSTSIYQPSDNPHSPLCPICARASCKYSRPYSNLFSEISPKFIPCPRTRTDSYYPSQAYENCMKMAKSEVISRPEPYSSKYSDENSLLNKILDEKIEKLLKPILLSLARSIPDDEEREMSRNSYGTFISCRDRPLKRTYSPPQSLFDNYLYTRPKSNFESPRRSSSPDSDYYRDRSRLKREDSYENFRRGIVLRDEERYSEPDRFSRRYSDEDLSKRRRPRSPGREYALDGSKRICPTTTSCEKRANVYFEPWQDLTTSSSQMSGNSIDLNRRINERTPMDSTFDRTDSVPNKIDLNKRLPH